MNSRTLLLFAVALLPVSALPAADDMADVEINTIPVAQSVFMLEGRGGNIDVSVGEDGILIVDDQFAPLAPKIEAAARDLDPGALRFVLNTHHHGDHTGGMRISPRPARQSLRMPTCAGISPPRMTGRGPPCR